MAYRTSDQGIKLLDTHVWIWAVDRGPRLSDEYFELISENLDSLAISAVSLWEVSMLVAKNKIQLSRPLDRWFDLATAGVGLTILPLTTIIALDAYALPGTFHDDPADRMIVATARVHDCLLLTEDDKIRKYRHVRVG